MIDDWKLPCVRIINIYIITRPVIHIGDFSACPPLKTLDLTSSADDWSVDITTIPRLPRHIHLSQVLNNSIEASGQVRKPRKSRWSLSKLHRLVLIGPPSSIFCLDWLNGCSDLELLQLRAYDEYGEHALSNSNEDLATPSTVSPNLVCPAALMAQPRTGSILKTVNFEGPGEYPRKFPDLSLPCSHPMPSSSKLTSSKAIQCFLQPLFHGMENGSSRWS